MSAFRPTSRLIVVNRQTHVLTLYKRRLLSSKLKLSVSYPIALGMTGHETPTGIYLINGRSKCPTWTMPESNWVPESEWGVTIPCGDPRNPIKARWLGIYEGVGIHGTDVSDSIGYDASHGCIRMRIPDVKALYPEVPLWTPVYIH